MPQIRRRGLLSRLRVGYMQWEAYSNTGRRKERLDAMASEINGTGDACLACAADVTDLASLKTAVETAEAHYTSKA